MFTSPWFLIIFIWTQAGQPIVVPMSSSSACEAAQAKVTRAMNPYSVKVACISYSGAAPR